MKFVPRRSQIIGRMVIKRYSSTIILTNETKVTKFILVDAVGEEAEASGVKVGDLIVPTSLGNIVMNEGFRPVLEEKSVAFFVTDVRQDELLVQTDTGARFVPFDSDEAAKPLGGVRSVGQESEAA